MKYVCTLVTLLGIFVSLSSAQDIAFAGHSSQTLYPSDVPGPSRQEWIHLNDIFTGSISKTKKTAMKNVTDSLVSFLQDCCFYDEDAAAAWHGEYQSQKNATGVQMSSGLECEFAEKKARLNILSNDISPLLEHLTIDNREWLALKPTAASKKDCPYFEFTDQDGMVTRMWLVTGERYRLPYTSVSRMEYLREASASLAKTKKEIRDSWKQNTVIRPAAVQEAEKTAMIERLNNQYTGTSLEIHKRVYLANYRTDEEYYQERADRELAGPEYSLHLVDSLLQYSASPEMAQPAIVSGRESHFSGFDQSATGRMLVRYNATYFDPSVSEEKPQLFVITWRFDPKDPAAVKLDHQLTEKLTIEKFRAIIGK